MGQIVKNIILQFSGIKSRRLSLKEILTQITKDDNSNLLLDNDIISLVYFRAGYSPQDYIDEENWKAREMLELSTAIKCPNINTFLCTFKIFQYYLQKNDVHQKFITEELIANDMHRFFVKIHYYADLSDDERKYLFDEMRKDTSKYVVKPQKEGGGNNYYSEDILKLLPAEDEDVSSCSDTIKSAIIMEKICPPQVETTILKEHTAIRTKVISEVSVYGIILSDDKQIYCNKSVGFLLRTKDINTNEGGIIVGSAAIDLPCLVDKRVDSNTEVNFEDI